MTRRTPTPDIVSALRRRVRQHLARTGALPAGARAVVAVSAGRDSVVLLDVLAALVPDLDLRLTVLHVDHGLRPEGPAEAAHVAALAAEHALPFRAARVAVARRRDGGASEAAARAARLRAFQEAAADAGADRVATGHTADDQVETLLLRLGRGSAPRGLAGMRAVDRAAGGLCLVRPLLAERRSAVAAYAAARGLRWLEDPTNDPTGPGGAYLRNRVRHTLLPAFTALFGDGVVGRLADLAALLGEERDLIAALLAAREGSWWQRLPAEGGVALDAAALARLPAAARRHVFVHALAALGLPAGFSRRNLQALAGLAETVSGSAALDLPDGVTARRAYGTLVLSRAPDRAEAAAPELVLPGPGRYRAGAVGLDVRLVERAPAAGTAGPEEAWIAAAADLFPLRLRAPRPGEPVAVPLGGAGGHRRVGHRRVARILIDRKVPRAERGAVRLLVDAADAPLWVVWTGRSAPAVAGMPASAAPLVAGAQRRGILRSALRPVDGGEGPAVRVAFVPAE